MKIKNNIKQIHLVVFLNRKFDLYYIKDNIKNKLNYGIKRII